MAMNSEWACARRGLDKPLLGLLEATEKVSMVRLVRCCSLAIIQNMKPAQTVNGQGLETSSFLGAPPRLRHTPTTHADSEGHRSATTQLLHHHLPPSASLIFSSATIANIMTMGS